MLFDVSFNEGNQVFSGKEQEMLDNTVSYILTFSIAFAVAYMLTPSVRSFALRFSVIDKRDIRKVHNKVVSRFGGLAIYLGFIFAMASSFFLNSGLEIKDIVSLSKVIMASTLILCLGIYDDIKGADAWIKLFIQVLAAVFLIDSGFMIKKIYNPFGSPIDLGVLCVPITILWLVGITNSINLIDGMDGLAGGVMFIASMGLFVTFLIMKETQAVAVFAVLALAGAVLAFLRYNWTPAKIFMGDTGSMFLGFTIAAIALMTSYKATTSIVLFVPIIALGIPIFDTTLAFGRRVLRRQNPFTADKDHLHHYLMRQNLGKQQVVIILLALTLALNIFAILLALWMR